MMSTAKYITVIIVLLFSQVPHLHSQFTKSQVDELTARGIFYALEPQNAYVMNEAEEITKNYQDSNVVYSLCSVFDYVNKKWNYQPDPDGEEYFEKAGVSVYTYSGDCDDYSILMVSLIKSLGGDGRVVCVSGHAYP